MRVLFAPETFNLGETSRGVEVARAMRGHGHEVHFMGYSHRFAQYIRDAGFTLDLLDPELGEVDADRLIAVDQGRSLRNPLTTTVLRERVASELDLIERWRPEVIVIGSTMSMFISARAARVPLVYIKPYAMSRSHLAAMTEFPLVSGSGALASLVNRGAGAAVRRVLPAVRWKPAAFRRVAAEHQVVLPARTVEAIDADLNLIASLFPALQEREMAQGEIAVGPVYATGDGELPERVRRLATRERAAVYVGMGSSSHRRLVLQVLAQVAGTGVDVVTSAGRYLTAADRAGLPGNVDVYDFLPAHRLTGLVDAAVIHGGEGSVQTACATGVPFAGIGLQAEQRINVTDCVRYGNAVQFTAADVRRDRLGAIVQQLLDDQTIRQAAERLQEEMRALDGPGASARLIAGLRH